jgi:hypothetical protein
MSSIGSEVGGKAAGGLNVDQQQYPFFQSPGGVTPQQTALSEYDYGQNLTEGQAQFEGSGQGGGPSLSTMATQVAGGANMGKALDLAHPSDVNQGAEYGAYQTGIGIDQQNNEALLAENQQNLSNATNLATLAGSATGGQAGAATTPGSSA